MLQLLHRFQRGEIEEASIQIISNTAANAVWHLASISRVRSTTADFSAHAFHSSASLLSVIELLQVMF